MEQKMKEYFTAFVFCMVLSTMACTQKEGKSAIETRQDDNDSIVFSQTESGFTVEKNIIVYEMTGIDVTFEIDGKGTILKYVGNVNDIVIPPKMGDIPITAIGEYAFSKKHLKSIVIPVGVTEIGNGAFEDNELININIPNSVTFIGAGAFWKNQLTSITIPDNVVSIYDYAFSYNQLISVTIPDSVNIIATGVFYNNPITSVTIGASVELGMNFYYDMIPGRSFDYDLDGLYKTNGKKDGTYILINGNWRITGKEITKENNFEIDKNGCITAYDGMDKSVIIPLKIGGIPVTAIGYGVFRGMGLVSVTIPDGVTSIGPSAFWKNQLKNITIPNSVTSVGANAFYDNQLTNISIPNSITSIGAYAFQRNQLTTVVIPNSITSIGEGAFQENQLTSVLIPDSVTSIGEGAFFYNQLASVTIGKNLEVKVPPELMPDFYSPVFSRSFDGFYNTNGRKAGTYVLNDGQWNVR